MQLHDRSEPVMLCCDKSPSWMQMPRRCCKTDRRAHRSARVGSKLGRCRAGEDDHHLPARSPRLQLLAYSRQRAAIEGLVKLGELARDTAAAVATEHRCHVFKLLQETVRWHVDDRRGLQAGRHLAPPHRCLRSHPVAATEVHCTAVATKRSDHRFPLSR